jgi:hypothetical protein
LKKGVSENGREGVRWPEEAGVRDRNTSRESAIWESFTVRARALDLFGWMDGDGKGKREEKKRG